MQEELANANKVAWETKAYQAWVQTYGTPDELASELKLKHKHHLRYWLKYIGNPTGKRVINLLGSHGRKAISLALLGADVTVVDISEENRLYAIQTAAAIGTAGLVIRTFEEIPSSTDPRFPAFYTLIADKMDIALSPLLP
ncbi:hypothetical protein [Paenibacillus luteus]|uniref:hypothetical protein n=1 Tax=Paenibacillus luteus TaxID=2545753 RepID=UPI001141190D|nr:hypothetical protein [Paenibacillus luteus]